MRPVAEDASPHAARRLFRRYALWIGASVFALMALNGLVQSWFVWRDTETALHERHRRIADAAAARLTAVLDDAVGHMAITLRQMDGWARLDPALRQQEMYRLLRAQRLFGAVRLEQADGTLLAQAGRLIHDAGLRFDERAGTDPGRAWPVPAPGGKPGYGQVFLLNDSEPRVRVALRGRPLDSGGAALVLAAELSLAPLGGVLTELAAAPGPGATLYLIDGQQRVIAHSDRGRSLAALVWRQLHPSASLPAPDATLQLAGDAPGGAALLSGAPVATLQALLVLDQARSEAWKPVLDSLARSALATAIALLLALAVAAWITRRMGSLFARLANANTRIQDQGVRLAALNVELAHRGDVAERANRAKTRFLAAASHDLRQPLHTVAVLADLLHRRLRHGDDGALALQMQEAVGAMDRLFQGILDLSKLDAGVVRAARQTVALGDVLKRVRASVAPLAAAHGVALRVRVGRHLAADRVDTDPVLLERILLNLAGNAVRYTPPGGAVLLGSRRREGHARIEVWDTGVGIAHDQQAQVFEEFVQLHNAEPQREQGLGLGLSVVQRLADLLGHPIGLRSRVGRGSCFHVDVPLVLPARVLGATVGASTHQGPLAR